MRNNNKFSKDENFAPHLHPTASLLMYLHEILHKQGVPWNWHRGKGLLEGMDTRSLITCPFQTSVKSPIKSSMRNLSRTRNYEYRRPSWFEDDVVFSDSQKILWVSLHWGKQNVQVCPKLYFIASYPVLTRSLIYPAISSNLFFFLLKKLQLFLT